jgi:V8-like Glu-specific endopeptidase/uncharacterized membrane protein required for colicin V production
MFGFNWIDLIILTLLVIAAIQGAKIGILTQTFSFIAFFGTLFLTGWLFPHILPIHNQNLKSFMVTLLVLLAASCAGTYGLNVGRKIHWSFRIGKRIDYHLLRRVESLLGILTGLAACLIAVWLIGVGFSRLPFEDVSNSVSDSKIVQKLVDNLPSVPLVFEELNKQLGINNQPNVSDQPKPYASFLYSDADYETAVAKTSPSVVRVTSFGCGGLISGSGFVIGPDLIATDAHVIAGVKRPIVKYDQQSYAAVPVYFNAELDLAILRVKNLDAPSLPIDKTSAQNNLTVAIVGYPGGNYTTTPGIIRNGLIATSGNIYDEGSSSRSAYGIQANIEDGSSGSPVTLPNGQAVGIIFSRSTTVENYSYALSSVYFKQALDQSRSSHVRVGVGACALI